MNSTDEFDRFFETVTAAYSRLNDLRVFLGNLGAEPCEIDDAAEWARRADICERVLASTNDLVAELLDGAE